MKRILLVLVILNLMLITEQVLATEEPVVNTEKNTITYDGKIGTYVIVNDEDSEKYSVIIKYNNCTYYKEYQEYVTTSGSIGKCANYDAALADKLYKKLDSEVEYENQVQEKKDKIQHQREKEELSTLLPFGIILIVLGSLPIINPYFVWGIRYGWKYKDSKPTEIVLTFIRFGGILTVLFGILIIIAILLS